VAHTIDAPASEWQTQPSLNEVERLAYEFWLERGAPVGNPEVDWLRAEQALRETASRRRPGGANDSGDGHTSPESARPAALENADSAHQPSATENGRDALSTIAKVIGSTLGSAAALVNAGERQPGEDRKL
jgi:hypothetical protein